MVNFEKPVLPQIEKGIPIPPRYQGFPVLNLMEPGDSVLLLDTPIRRIASILFNKKKRNGRAFAARKVSTSNLRVWRIS